MCQQRAFSLPFGLRRGLAKGLNLLLRVRPPGMTVFSCCLFHYEMTLSDALTSSQSWNAYSANIHCAEPAYLQLIFDAYYR